MKINTKNIEIRLCTSNDVKAIYEIQNIVINNFKENEKGYFLPFKEESYLRIVNDPFNEFYKYIDGDECCFEKI